MRVVGLDLSLTATGVATEAGAEVLATKLRGCERLAWVRDSVMALCAPVEYRDDVVLWEMRPPLVVLEGYAYARANQAHQIGELGGVIRLALWEAGVPFVEVAPAALKKYATGRGNAGKGEVLAAAIRRLGYGGHDDNEADALWLRTMGLAAYRLAPLTKAQGETLGKVDWPELAVTGEGQ